MARSDWGTLTAGIDSADVRAGATAGATAPNGGGTHVYGLRLVEDDTGAYGLYLNQTNFAPTPSDKGGRISCAMRRAAVASTTGFAPFMYFCASGTTVAANAYLLGLTDESASHIQLRKGAISLGQPVPAIALPATAPNVLMRSSDTFQPDTWQHLRLDVIVQGTGDVILQVFRNDLSVNPVTNPVWAVVPGMEGAYVPAFQGFVDDALGVNTGSTPLTSGYAGFGARFETSNRTVYFDQVAIDRQL